MVQELHCFENLSIVSREIIASCLSVIFVADYSVSHFVLKLVGQTLYSVWGLGGVFYLDVFCGTK